MSRFSDTMSAGKADPLDERKRIKSTAIDIINAIDQSVLHRRKLHLAYPLALGRPPPTSVSLTDISIAEAEWNLAEVLRERIRICGSDTHYDATKREIIACALPTRY